MSPEKPRRLGRGLEALIGAGSSGRTEAGALGGNQNELRRLSIARIRPNPFQPRREFAEAELDELRASLKTSGMLQPVVVRPVGDTFELISGERRFRAASQLGWREIPALVREADERTMLTLALIENLQRTDLNAVEEARGYQRLQEEFDLTHQQISEAVGKDRSTVTNLLRLLALPPDVQELLEHGRITIGHGKALLALGSPDAMSGLAADIAAEGLSVRETEQRVRVLSSASTPAKPRGSNPSRPGTDPATPSASLRHLQDALRRRLQTDVHIQMSAKQRGSIRIDFYSTDDLNRLFELLNGAPQIGD